MPRRSPAASRRRRTPTWLLCAALVLGLQAGCGPSPAPEPTPAPSCALPDPRPRLVAGSLRLPASPSVLVLGDSYTEGWGAVPETRGWAYLIRKQLPWRVTVAGVGGTGYVNAGPQAQGTYLQRLPALQHHRFDLVVLQGGSNDRGVTYPALRDAVGRTIDAARNAFPGAVVLLLGPASPYGRSDDARQLSQCVLAGYASAQSLAFLDPMAEGWFVEGDGQRYANPDNGHPSNAGYQHYADRFEADVRVLSGAG